MEHSLVFQEKFEQLLSFLDVKGNELCDFLKEPTNLIEHYENRLHQLPAEKAFSLSEKLNLDYESFVKGKYDPLAASEHLKGNHLYLPSRYNQYRSSKMMTMSNILDTSTFFFDQNVTSEISRKLQLSNELIESPNHQVSGLLLLDLFKELKRRGISDNYFYLIGHRAALKYKSSVNKEYQIKGLSPKYTYEKIILNLVNFLEKNLQYTIVKSTNKKTILKASTREETKDKLKVIHFGIPAHCQNIMGWYGAFLNYSHDTFAKVTKLSCVHSGAKDCLYEIDYSHAPQSLFSHPNHCETLQ
ncbi:MAG: hypothetical protein HOE90_24545 [Bacteriovoracaceae bacterium]|nr:hypothetical protein [Bacteriovoracaceae bacterium]